MKPHIDTQKNVVFFSILFLLNGFNLFILPFLLNSYGLWLIILAVPAVAFSNTYWALIHEGIHTLLFANRKLNENGARLLSVFLGCSFHILRATHLLHHKVNRSEHDRFEVFDAKKQTRLGKTVHYYWWITGGLYQTEVLAPLASFLPQQFIINLLKKSSDSQFAPEAKIFFLKFLSKRSNFTKMRVDTATIILVFCLSFYLYGHFWWVLLIMLLIRGILISAADNLPHYATPIDDRRYAFNLMAPKWLRLMILNFNYHRIHHVYPNVPWHQLPEKCVEVGDKLDLAYGRQWLNQFKGLIPIEGFLSADPLLSQDMTESKKTPASSSP